MKSLKSSHIRHRSPKMSQSADHLQIQHNLLISQQQRYNNSLIYQKNNRQRHVSSINKKDRFLIQLPKIYPIHKKISTISKLKQLQMLRLNDRKFQLRGIKYLNDNNELYIQSSAADSNNNNNNNNNNANNVNSDDIQKNSSLNMNININSLNTNIISNNSSILKNKQISASIQNYNIFSQLILRINHITQINSMKGQKIKAYVEEGNNSRLVKELLRKRSSIKLVNDKKQADIVWTRFSDYMLLDKYSKFTLLNNGNHNNNNTSTISSYNNSSTPSLKPNINDQQLQQSYYKLSKLPIKQSQFFYPKKQIIITQLFIHNHIKNHQQLSDKKNLFKNIVNYCEKNIINSDTIIPKTYHIDICKVKDQKEIQIKIEEIFQKKDKENTLSKQNKQNIINNINNINKQNNINLNNINNNNQQKQLKSSSLSTYTQSSFFIIKPGQDTNRGQGISIARGKQNILKSVMQLQKINKSSLIQQYISPLLHRNRKFDIRCYVLLTLINGQLHAYWYKQGYLRTCSKQFNYDPSNIYGHLTNDAVQKKHKDYGKYQQSNKLSFNDLQQILHNNNIDKSLQSVTLQMKQLAFYSIKSVQQKIKPQKNIIGFEIFGYDFLIDKNGKVWLIEVNTNPCLEFAGSLLSRIIWHMVDNSFKIAIDPIIENQHKREFQNYVELNRFQCII